MSNLIVGGVPRAINSSSAKIIFVMNLMTKYTQTHGMSANDHLDLVEKTIKKRVDFILMNSEKIPKDIENMYLADKEFLVVDDLKGDKRVIRADFVKPIKIVKSEHDTVHRSYLRHDPKCLEGVFRKIFG